MQKECTIYNFSDTMLNINVTESWFRPIFGSLEGAISQLEIYSGAESISENIKMFAF